jgi:DNA-directed RNA polymerase subunit H (RpoH/RPB5)
LFDPGVHVSVGKNLFNQLVEKYISKARVILLAKLSTRARHIIVTEKLLSKGLELISVTTFGFDKLLSRQVPRYRLLSQDEIDRFLKEKLVTKQQLPLMMRDDAICLFAGWKPGDVLMIDATDSVRLVV